jgi:uncharacterized protein
MNTPATHIGAHVLESFETINDLELPAHTARPNPLHGKPAESALPLYEDGRCKIGVWECTPGIFRGVKDGVGEHAFITAGEATVYGDDGTVVELLPGVSFVTPRGWSGRWEVRQTVRKQYTVWKA